MLSKSETDPYPHSYHSLIVFRHNVHFGIVVIVHMEYVIRAESQNIHNFSINTEIEFAESTIVFKTGGKVEIWISGLRIFGAGDGMKI